MWFNRKPFISLHITRHVDSINSRFYSRLFYRNIANIELRRTQRVRFINGDIRDMMVRSYEKDS